LVPPDFGEAQRTAQAIAAAIAPDTGLTDFQRVLLEALYVAMTGHRVQINSTGPMTPLQIAESLRPRNLAFRTRGVQIMLLCALILRPLPPEVAERIAAVAGELGVDEKMIDVARDLAEGSLGLAAVDFDRNGYTDVRGSSDEHVLHTSTALRSAWDMATDDPALAMRWKELEHLPHDSLGRRVADFYRARGFVYPGLPGSAPPLLAQHDWVHVLADYGTMVESELEVFAFIARANDDMHAFSMLAMVVSLFETGYLARGAGLFQADRGHLARTGMPARLADAMRRGALCQGSIDFMKLDWFELADMPVADVRGHFGVPRKSDDARAAGSPGPWETGGISPFQVNSGTELARREGRPYESFGAAVRKQT
jgi:hypothetical protein